MKKKENNYAFIDGQNLYLSIKALGWSLEYFKFRRYLKEKYSISRAFIFLGYNANNKNLYGWLHKVGYICVFKPILVYENGEIKGNCDAELVLHSMIEIDHFDKAVIISGDGDFHCLIKHLIKMSKLKKLLIPNEFTYSALLKRFPSEYLAFISSLKKKVSCKNKKNPVRTEP